MLWTIVPDVGRKGTPPPVRRVVRDASAMQFALDRMSPGLLLPVLPGEDLADAEARRVAALDIFDDLLAEYEEVAS